MDDKKNLYMDKINRYFNYLLFNGYEYIFDDIHICGYPYPLLK